MALQWPIFTVPKHARARAREDNWDATGILPLCYPWLLIHFVILSCWLTLLTLRWCLKKRIFVTGLVKCLGLFCAFGKGLIVWSYLCLCGFRSAPEVILSKYFAVSLYEQLRGRNVLQIHPQYQSRRVQRAGTPLTDPWYGVVHHLETGKARVGRRIIFIHTITSTP